MTPAPPATGGGAARMSRAHRAYVLAMSAILGGAFAYAASDWGRWPHLMYLPLSRELTTSASPAITVHYLGTVAWGVGGALAGALVGALLCRIAPRPWRARTYQLLGAWALTALALAGGYFTWALWPW